MKRSDRQATSQPKLDWKFAVSFAHTLAFRHATVPLFNWNTTWYRVLEGAAFALGTSATESAPPAPNRTLVFPAATAWPFAVVNAGHEIRRVPPAGRPSARKTVSLTVVNCGDCPHASAAVTSRHKKSRPHGRLRLSNMRIPPSSRISLSAHTPRRSPDEPVKQLRCSGRVLRKINGRFVGANAPLLLALADSP